MEAAFVFRVEMQSGRLVHWLPGLAGDHSSGKVRFLTKEYAAVRPLFFFETQSSQE